MKDCCMSVLKRLQDLDVCEYASRQDRSGCRRSSPKVSMISFVFEKDWVWDSLGIFEVLWIPVAALFAFWFLSSGFSLWLGLVGICLPSRRL